MFTSEGPRGTPPRRRAGAQTTPAEMAGAGAAGGGAAIAEIVTKGSIKVPAETVLTFQLDAPLRVAER